jgi:predicted permease
VVLLVGAGLLARSFARLTRVDPGFRAERLLVINPSLPRAIQADSVRGMQSLQSMLTRLAALPGVTAVTAGSQPPFVGGTSSSFFRKEGEPDQATNGTFQMGAWARGHQAQQRVVIPGYFATLGIPLRAGRDFTPDDRAGAEKVAIVSEALVRRDYPGESPLGKKVFYQGAWRTIVGVVGDVHFQRLSNDLEASLYTPYLQRSMSASLLVRTAGDPAQLIPALRKAVTEAEPAALVNRVDIMSVAIAQSFADERYRATLISLFGILAALLAAVGMYGVTSRAVARRTREVAIRLALGASRLSIEKTVIGATLSGVIIGVLAGMLGALGLTRFLAPYLFGVSATDPWTYAGILGLLAAVCVGASWVPARRAGRVGLAEVLRGE